MNSWRKVMTLTKPQSASIRRLRKQIVNAVMFETNNDENNRNIFTATNLYQKFPK